MGARGWRAWAARVLCFVVPAVCAADYTINRFMRIGAEVWDSGWFAWLSTHATAWPMANPPAIGGSFLAIHFAPIFFLLTALHGSVAWVPTPSWFALSQGLWFGLLGLACALCAGGLLPGRAGLAAGLGLVSAGNGIALATVGFPHFEIAMTALLFLAIALRRRTRWWGAVLLLMLTVREDAGLHAALAFAALGLLRAWAVRDGAVRDWRAGLPEARVALFCIAASLGAIVTQHLALDGGNALAGTYLGDPPLGHMTGALVAERLHLLFRDRSYVWGPLLLLALQAAFWRDLRLLAGVAICLPWIAFSFIARSEQAALMWSYYSLPVMVGLCWPLLAGRALGVNGRDAWRYAAAQLALAVLSIGLFVGSGNNHDRRPWRNFDQGGWAQVGPNERAMDWLLAHRAAFGRMLVDDRVAALRPAAFGAGELRFGLAFSPTEIRAADTLVEWPGGWLAARKRAIIEQAGLDHRMSLPGSAAVLHSRRALPLQ